MMAARDADYCTALDHAKIAVLAMKCPDRYGFEIAGERLSKAFILARKDMDRAAMQSITRMRNWLRADLRKITKRDN